MANQFFQTLKKRVQKKYDSIDNHVFKNNLLNALPFWTGAILTGIISIFYSKLFGWAEDGSAYLFKHISWVFILVTPLAFVLAWWLTKKYAPFARGSGIPQVIAAIELTNPKQQDKVGRLLGVRIAIIKILSSLVMVLGGGAIGREGPTIQIASSIFKKINDWLPEWYPKISKRNMIVTGAAAGLASAFNTPLGGIVFAIEELTKTHFNFFKSALLTGVIIAGLTSLNFLGPYLYLGYPEIGDFSILIVFAVIPVAIVTGISGSVMGEVILYLLKFKKRFKKNFQQVLFVLLCGLILASIAVFFDARIMGSGKEIMQSTLFSHDKHVEWYVPLLRVIGPIVSFTSGAAGGIFAPSLSAGAGIGSAISGWLHLSSTESNLMILCGMVGFLTGITKSPFTSSILVLEMTNNHNIIFHLMFTALVASLLSNYISRKSFYDQLKDQYVGEVHTVRKRPIPAKQ